MAGGGDRSPICEGRRGALKDADSRIHLRASRRTADPQAKRDAAGTDAALFEHLKAVYKQHTEQAAGKPAECGPLEVCGTNKGAEGAEGANAPANEPDEPGAVAAQSAVQSAGEAAGGDAAEAASPA